MMRNSSLRLPFAALSLLILALTTTTGAAKPSCPSDAKPSNCSVRAEAIVGKAGEADKPGPRSDASHPRMEVRVEAPTAEDEAAARRAPHPRVPQPPKLD